MSLRVIGNFNKISDELRATIPPLLPGKSVTYELINGVYDPATKQKYFGGDESFPCSELIIDPFTKEAVTIGIPKEIVNGEVLRPEKISLKEFCGGGTYMNARFTFYGDQPSHHAFHAYMWLSSKNQDSPCRNQKVQVMYKHINSVVLAKKSEARFDLEDEAMMEFRKYMQSHVRMKELFQALNYPAGLEYTVARAQARQYARDYPQEFLDLISDESPIKLKADIKNAFDLGVLIYDAIGHRVLGKDSKPIAQLLKDDKLSHYELFEAWVDQNTNGVKVMELVRKKISAELAKQKAGDD